MAIYKTIIIEQKKVAEGTLEITLKRPSNFSFEAGQYIQLSVPELLYPDYKGSSRVFSIVSTPLDKRFISIAFRNTGSGFKKTLKELPAGASVSIDGPHGFFTLPQDSLRQFVFVAGGIGIAPYFSIIRAAIENESTCHITLLYSNKHKDSATYLKELQNMAGQNENFILKNKFGVIDGDFIHRSVKDIRDSIWHIAGPPSMVDNVRGALHKLGVGSEQVHYEGFVGY